jgi:hypothetical protein
MKINNLDVTSTFFDLVDETSAHLELEGCVRLVHLSDVEFETIEALKIAIESLTFE